MGHAVDNPAVITMACARPCDSDVAGPKAAWTNYRIFWEVGFLSGILKVYLAGIGETDDFRLLARRLPGRRRSPTCSAEREPSRPPCRLRCDWTPARENTSRY